MIHKKLYFLLIYMLVTTNVANSQLFTLQNRDNEDDFAEVSWPIETSIAMLRQDIETQMNIPTNHLFFQFDNRILQDTETLQSAGLRTFDRIIFFVDHNNQNVQATTEKSPTPSSSKKEKEETNQ